MNSASARASCSRPPSLPQPPAAAPRPPTTAASDGGTAADGEVKTDKGVQGTEITLGVLTDLTGVFAALGNDITNANTLYWEKQNAGDKVCGKYTVKLNVKDTGYVPQQGVQLYAGMKDDVLAMQQTIGSPINTALGRAYTADKIVNFPSAWARNLTEPPGNGVVGATYDVEMVNGLHYALTRTSSRRATSSATSTSRASTARTASPAPRPSPPSTA